MTVRIFPDEIILGNLVIIGNLVIMEGFPGTGMFGGVGWWRVEILRVMLFGGMG
jgi:hypothetical protein